MLSLNIIVVVSTLIVLSHSARIKRTDELFTINVTMKDYQTSKEDQYAFVGYKLPDEELNIIGYSPLISMNSAHHMLTYACENPGSSAPVWEGGSPCGYGHQMIIHGWARNAPALSLPEDVAFVVGRNTPFKHIVVNIHYLSILKNDFSGNQLILSRNPRKYRAGVMLGGTNNIYLRPKSHSVQTPFSCKYDGPPINIFAARVHAHQWGRVNSLYRIRNQEISQIVKGDPQWPQSFYSLPEPVKIISGDYVVGQCVYDNNEDRLIQVGSTHNDEMCNVYSMYSYEPFDNEHNEVIAPFQNCWNNVYNQLASLIPADAEVPPIKPADIGQTNEGNHMHAEHAMVSPNDNERILLDDDSSSEYDSDEMVNFPYLYDGSDRLNVNNILSHLGLPDYEYIDAQNYDHLLPQHLTYGTEQTVKIRYGKKLSSSLYVYVDNWPDRKSLPTPLGEIGGIALNTDNSELVVFHRGSRKWEFKYFADNYRFRNELYGPIDEDVLIHIDTRTGQTKSQWGAKMFYLPHGLTIDNEGNFWVTDIAMHQVFMFRSTDLTHPALTVGKMFQAGSGPNHFCRPADVAVMTNGDFFVADGYCNNRIVKFNRKGEYITEWGSSVSGRVDADGFNMPNEWNVVHSIALSEKAQLLCAADRENDRIQCFNLTTGQFQRQIRVEAKKHSGSFYAIEFVPNANGTILFAVTGGASAAKRVYMIDAQNGEILTSFDSNPSLMSPHDITVSSNAREIYVGELSAATGSLLHKFEFTTRKDLPTQTFTRQTDHIDKNFRTSLWIMIAFAIPVALSVVIGIIVRMKTLREQRNIDGFMGAGQRVKFSLSSILGVCFKRQTGFKRLGQYSDEDNEELDNETDDEFKENFENETITLPPSVPIAITNGKNANISS